MIVKLTNWLNRESSSITVAAFLLAAASFSADILGLVRDRILASQFGAGDLLDIYYAGFRIPDLLLNLLVLGAVSSAFLPIFADRYGKDRDDAWRLSANVFTLAALALVACAAALAFFAHWLLPLVVPGFDSTHLQRAVSVTRMLLLGPVLFGLSSIVSAVLHYFQRFFFYALAPILYNFGIIIGAVFLAPRFGELGLAGGVIVGAVLHLAIQLPAAWAMGFRLHFHVRPVHAAVRDVIRLAIPRTGNLVVNQLQITALTAIASIFVAGSIAVFNFGMNLAFVPVGVVGISFATAAFPVLSRAYASGDVLLFARTLRQTIQEILFFVLPAAALFLVLRAHIVRVVLGTGAFTWEDTRLTAAVLGAFALGIIALSLLPLLMRAFFAQKDTLTPFLISFASTVSIVIFAMVLSGALSSHGTTRSFIGALFRVDDLADIRVLALPVAMTVVSTLQMALLIIALRTRVLAVEAARLAKAAFRLVAASAIAGLASWGALQFFAKGVAQETFIGIFLQGSAAAIAGILVYLILALLFSFPELRRFVGILRRSVPPLAAILPSVGLDGGEGRDDDGSVDNAQKSRG